MTQDQDKNNPYVKLRKQEEGAEETPSSEQPPDDRNIEDEDLSKAHYRKRVAYVLAGILVLIATVSVLYWKYGNTVTVKQHVEAQQTPKDRAQPGASQQSEIEAVIARAKKERSQATGEIATPSPLQEQTDRSAATPAAEGEAAPAATTIPTSPRLIIPDYSMQTPQGRTG